MLTNITTYNVPDSTQSTKTVKTLLLFRRSHTSITLSLSSLIVPCECRTSQIICTRLPDFPDNDYHDRNVGHNRQRWCKNVRSLADLPVICRRNSGVAERGLYDHID